jgi:hypothetical protein
MKEIIRQILREELGVPKGLLDVSKTVFDDFKNYFLSAIDENQNEYNFVIVPTQEAKIGDMVIDEIVFDIQIHEDSRFNEFNYARMGVSFQAKIDNTNKPRLVSKDYDGVVEFEIHFVTPEGWKEQDVINYLQKNRSELLSSFSHELKHVYDGYKKPTSPLTERIDYETAKKLMDMFPPLRKFSFVLYYTHVIENLVRPTELASAIESNEITKQNFIEFIKNQKTYQYLTYGKNLTLESLKEKLITKIPEIEKLFDIADVEYDGINDKEKVEKLLNLYFVNMTNNKIEMFTDGLSDDIFEKVFGFSGDKFASAEKYQNQFRKYVNTPEDYFKKEISEINKTSDKVLRKLLKLYALAK